MSDEEIVQAQEEGGALVPIEWYFPETIQSRYATNIIVHHSKTEFVISFFETIPPPLLGTPEEIQEQMKSIKSVRAECVGRIIVAAEKMPDFLKAMQENLEKYNNKFQENE